MRLLTLLTFVAALGSGLVAGVFFAFSAFVMQALGRLPADKGIAAMQSINVAAITPVFMAVFLGTAASSLALAVPAGLRLSAPGSGLVLTASLLYLVGVFGVTIAFNVPLNDALAGVKWDSAEGADLWRRYLGTWTFWNHARTFASLLSLLLFLLAMTNRFGSAERS